MEASDQSGSIDSDSFFAIDTIAESNVESQSSEDKIIPLKKLNPIYLIYFVDFLGPFMLFLCSISTTSFVGLVYLIILMAHIIICSRLTNRYFSLLCILYIEIFISLLIFVVAIISPSEPNVNSETFKISRIIGISFDSFNLKTTDFAIVSSLMAIVCQSIPISILGHTTIQSYLEKRKEVYSNCYFLYSVGIIHSFSIAFLPSAHMSYAFYPILIYFSFINLTLSTFGREIMWYRFKMLMTFYTLLYSIFDFYMSCHIGIYWNPSAALGYKFIGNETSRQACLVFSVLLIYTSLTMLTSQNPQKENFVPIPIFVKKSIVVLIVILFLGIYCYAVFFPNYLTILWQIIILFSTFSGFDTISKYFFPFFAVVFIITFLGMAITQYDVIPRPYDNGSEELYTFLKLFGIYKYYDTHDNFVFCLCGYYVMAIFGQIGRVKYSLDNQPKSSFRKFNSEKNYYVQHQYILDAISSLFSVAKKGIEIFLKYFIQLVYFILTYFSLPACVILAIYAGMVTTKWSFQVLSFFMIFVVLLFQYFKWAFEFMKVLAGVIILLCAFYKSSDTSYECRGKKHCLFFGYFEGIEESGLCPPPNETLHSYCWQISFVYIFSTYLTYDQKALNTYYPSVVIAILYICVAICDFIYVFSFDLSIFTLIYFFVGCLIIGFQCLGWNTMRTITIMFSFIAVSIQITIYNYARHDGQRNFFLAHVPLEIINVEMLHDRTGEIILLDIMLFLSSIVFHGAQKLKSHDLAFSIIQEIRKISHDLYFYISWLFIFYFCMANEYPTFIKLIFLFFFIIGSISPQIFYRIRFHFLFVAIVFLIVQFVFHIFVHDLSPNVQKICEYVGVYFDIAKLENENKNIAIGWQFAYIILSVLNFPGFKQFTHPDHFEKKNLKRFYNGICSFLHFCLPLIVQITVYICTSYTPTIFSWFTYIIMIISLNCPNFFRRTCPTFLFVVDFFLLAQYLLYLGLPDGIFGIQKWSILDKINPSQVETVRQWFEFLGIISVKRLSLIINCILAIIFTFYIQYTKKTVNYRKSYSSLPLSVKCAIDFIVINIFEICMPLILICASLTSKPDGLFLFAMGSFFFTANLLFDYSQMSTHYIIGCYIFVITFLRILSRLPIFVDNKMSNFVIRLFDLPLNGESSSVGLWIIIFTLHQLCIHIQRSELYKQLSEKKMKKLAYRFIRERQLRIIEKLDQDILLKKRSQEMYTLNVQHDIDKVGDQLLDITNNNEQLIRAENQSKFCCIQEEITKEKEVKIRWYHKLYLKYIEPQFIRIVRLLATSFPVNQEAGVNVLTLESLTLLMRRCLSYYDRNQEFNLEERERQFLLSLPPSFSYHFSSIFHLIDYQTTLNENVFSAFGRYMAFLVRKLSLPILVLCASIYMLKKPYIFGIIIFAYVICIFCSYDFSGFPNIYRIFLTIVLLILALKSIAQTDMIFEKLKNISSSLVNIQNTISTLSLIGLEPDENSTIEIFLFLASVLFIVDQLGTVRVFPANYYYEKYAAILPGFPTEYCYGIMDDPVRNLGMNIPQNRTFINSLKQSTSRVWLRSTIHQNFILFLDMMSLLVLLVCWTNWEEGDIDLSEDSYVFFVNTLFVFILIFHVIFSMVVYFCCLGDLFLILSGVEVLWLLYSFAMIFFYIRSKNHKFQGTAIFYTILRMLQHIIAAHVCFIGRTNVSYRYPEFSKEWKRIRFFDKILRYFPFAFEIQSVLLWIGNNTLIPFADYLVVHNMELMLEIQICNKMDLKKGTKPKKRVLKGICILFVFICAIFIPMLFLLSAASTEVSNKVLMAKITAGIGTLPPFYESTASARQISTVQQQMLARNDDPDISALASRSTDTLYLCNFPVYSNYPFQATKEYLNEIRDMITTANNNNSVKFFNFYVKYSIYFERPTTSGRVSTGAYVLNGQPVSGNYVLDLFQTMFTPTHSIYSGIYLPRIFIAVANEKFSYLKSDSSDFNFVYSGDSYFINMSKTSQIPFMNDTAFYKVLVYSSHVLSDSNAQDYYELTEGGSFLGIYLLMLFILGIAIRDNVSKKVDAVWREKIRNPFKLYRMIIAINMFKNSRDIIAEKEMCDRFLNSLKSQQRVYETTKND